MQWDPPVFRPPFEFWRDGAVLHLSLREGARLTAQVMKEMVRLVSALDRNGRSPVLIDHAPGVTIEDDARALLVRVCRVQGHPVIVYSGSEQCRMQVEVFRQVHRPRFPLRVFASREEAWRWAQAFQQSELERSTQRGGS